MKKYILAIITILLITLSSCVANRHRNSKGSVIYTINEGIVYNWKGEKVYTCDMKYIYDDKGKPIFYFLQGEIFDFNNRFEFLYTRNKKGTKGEIRAAHRKYEVKGIKSDTEYKSSKPKYTIKSYSDGTYDVYEN